MNKKLIMQLFLRGPWLFHNNRWWRSSRYCQRARLSYPSHAPLPVYCLTDLLQVSPFSSLSVLLRHTLNNLSLFTSPREGGPLWRDSLLTHLFHLHAAYKHHSGLSLRQMGRPAPINQHSWDICGQLGGRFMPTAYQRASIRLSQKGWGGRGGRQEEGHGWKKDLFHQRKKRILKEGIHTIKERGRLIKCSFWFLIGSAEMWSAREERWMGGRCRRVKRRCQVVTEPWIYWGCHIQITWERPHTHYISSSQRSTRHHQTWLRRKEVLAGGVKTVNKGEGR